MRKSYLDFEKPVADLEAQVDELKALAGKGEGVSIEDEIETLQGKADQALKALYGALTPWQKTQVRAIRSARTSSITAPA